MQKKKFVRIAAVILIFTFAAVLIFELHRSIPTAGEMVTETENDRKFIKWVEFDVSYSALSKALELDIKNHDSPTPTDWVTLLACLGAKYGGDFSRYQERDLLAYEKRLLDGESIEQITEKMTYFPYYSEAYGAVLGGMVGPYSLETVKSDGTKEMAETYGLKAFSPIAKGFDYSDYDDFGAGRTYGYRRRHLGHDLIGLTGTPIIAIESGIVEVMGWNQYGGWRIGIRSFDGLRYYYYAHLRQNRPYHVDLKEGEVVRAGDVIGYLGHTGYSTKENTNNIDTPHLHVGLQLIFDPSQKEGSGEIWVNLYPLTRLLARHRSEVYRVAETKEFYRVSDFDEPALKEYRKEQKINAQ